MSTKTTGSSMKNRTVIIGILVIAGIIGTFYFNRQKNTTPPSKQASSLSDNLSPEKEITHGHGLAVDRGDSSKLYIATHHGLLVLVNDKDLYRVGKSRDDYMGFSPHPTDPKIFFSSGHPQTGGNIGFQQSIDNAVTWQKIGNGVDGPVDFHAMAVSPANTNLVYGWYRGNIQVSKDQGKTWYIAGPTNFVVVHLAADPKEESKMYAASPQGLFVSSTSGKEWQPINELQGSFVFTLAIDPQNNQTLLSFSEKLRLAKSTDGGNSWSKINEPFEGGTVFFLAFDPQMPSTIYALTEKNLLFKSLDAGETWIKIR